jgi:hypothetical protein
MSDNVYILKNTAGSDACPAGKLGLYTNINFNNSEAGDVLVMSPGIQLDTAQLEGYGFIVGGHDGISSVVNNMDTDATLVAGLYLDGKTLIVPKGAKFSSLLDYPLGGNTWNDATKSVVSSTVTTISLLMKIAAVDIPIGEEYYASLELSNSSSRDIKSASVTASVEDSSIVSISVFKPAVNIPANGSVNIYIPLVGIDVGETSLTCQLVLPIGYINSNPSIISTKVTVSESKSLQVSQTYLASWQQEWGKPEYIYSYHLVLTSQDENVKSWELSFILPEGAEVSPDWLASNASWITLNTKKPDNNYVYLDSISGNIISPNQDLPMDIQIIYPKLSSDYKVIKNMSLEQLT